MKVLIERETTDYMERLGWYETEERERWLEESGTIRPQRTGHMKRER